MPGQIIDRRLSYTMERNNVNKESRDTGSVLSEASLGANDVRSMVADKWPTCTPHVCMSVCTLPVATAKTFESKRIRTATLSMIFSRYFELLLLLI